jgi:hypothetical protein
MILLSRRSNVLVDIRKYSANLSSYSRSCLYKIMNSPFVFLCIITSCTQHERWLIKLCFKEILSVRSIFVVNFDKGIVSTSLRKNHPRTDLSPGTYHFSVWPLCIQASPQPLGDKRASSDVALPLGPRSTLPQTECWRKSMSLSLLCRHTGEQDIASRILNVGIGQG